MVQREPEDGCASVFIYNLVQTEHMTKCKIGHLFVTNVKLNRISCSSSKLDMTGATLRTDDIA
jgi:hypothetical protein